METPQTESKFEFNPATHSYYLDGREMTGCTTILGVIAKPALIQWSANEACKYVKENAYKALSLKGALVTEQLDAILEEARYAHRKKKDDAASKGTDIHAEVELIVKTAIEKNDGYIQNWNVDYDCTPVIEKFVGWAKHNNIKFLASEKQFYSKSLFVAGTCDLLFEKDGKRYVGDIKTFKKLWDRTPFFQMGGYAIMAEEMDEKPFDGYVVLNLSKEGTFEDYWSYDVEGDKKGFLSAVELYRRLKDFSY